MDGDVPAHGDEPWIRLPSLRGAPIDPGGDGPRSARAIRRQARIGPRDGDEPIARGLGLSPDERCPLTGMTLSARRP